MNHKKFTIPVSHIITVQLIMLAITASVRGETVKTSISSTAVPSAADAIEAVHQKLAKRFIQPNGLLVDWAQENGAVILPTPEECAVAKPNGMSWNMPIVDCAFLSGLYLSALSRRWQRTGADVDKTAAQKMAAGLMLLSEVSDVPGFIARGVGSDGKCHYPCGSDDQTHPWFFGLYRYFRSGIADERERTLIIRRMTDVADALQSNRWRAPCDGVFKGQYNGGVGPNKEFRATVRHLFLLRAMAAVTGDERWQHMYEEALRMTPKGADKTCLDICGEGYFADAAVIKGLETGGPLWIFVGAQASLRELAVMETDSRRAAVFRKGLSTGAMQAAKTIDVFRTFDNAADTAFPLHEWRILNALWREQKTPADAAKLGDEQRKLSGPRRNYENQYMQVPLASALMTALSGDREIIGQFRPQMEAAFRHYDWNTLNTSFFFFAEFAWEELAAFDRVPSTR